MAGLFQDENRVAGLPPGTTAPAQAGVSNVGANSAESGFGLPWCKDKETSWLDYSCWVEVQLDSGMVLHKALPQQTQQGVDTLASATVQPLASNFATLDGGVELESVGNYEDTIQRMATSEYTFVLKGYGMRAGYKVPVPGLKSVAGITPTPTRQWSSGNRVIANYSGVPIFFCQWELWYIVSVPPEGKELPPPNLAEHIRGDAQLPTEMQIPYTQPDSNAVAAIPVKQDFFVPGK